jgi:hypothetical protein
LNLFAQKARQSAGLFHISATFAMAGRGQSLGEMFSRDDCQIRDKTEAQNPSSMHADIGVL